MVSQAISSQSHQLQLDNVHECDAVTEFAVYDLFCRNRHTGQLIIVIIIKHLQCANSITITNLSNAIIFKGPDK